MKATRVSLAFAAATFAALLAPATTQAREFYNGRLDGGMVQGQIHPTSTEDRWLEMGRHERAMTAMEITARVTLNKKGRATQVVLNGTTGKESLDYTIRRMLLRKRFDITPEEAGQPLVVAVQYRAA